MVDDPEQWAEDQLREGFPEDEVRQTLINEGYNEAVVDEIMNEAASTASSGSSSGSVASKNPLLVLGLTFVTFGIYGIYWYYLYNSQLQEYLEADFSAGLRTALLFLPLVNLYAWWAFFGSVGEANQDTNPVLLFLAMLIFPPLGIFLTQSALNDI